jgi:hypothetical protein
MWLLFQLDGILFGFLLLSSSSVILFSSGSGLTIFKYRHIAKPCPLAAMSNQPTGIFKQYKKIYFTNLNQTL